MNVCDERQGLPFILRRVHIGS